MRRDLTDPGDAPARRSRALLFGALVAACGDPTHPPTVSEPGDVRGAGAGAPAPSAPIVRALPDATRPNVTVTVLARDQARPRGLASDGTFLDYTTAGTGALDGTVRRVDLQSHQQSTLVSGLASPGDLISRNGALFFVDRGTSMFSATGAIDVLVAGAAPHALASGEIAPMFLAADATRVYWESNDFGAGVSVSRAPLAGGHSEVLTTAPGPYFPGGIAVDTAFVYFVAHGEGTGTLYRASLAGETPEVLWDSDAGEPIGLVLSGATLYWVVDDAPPNGAVFSMPITGTQPTRIAAAQDHPVALAISGGTLYYVTDPPGAGGQLLRIPTTGGSAPVVLLSGLDQPRAIQASDRIHVATRDQILEISK